MFADGHCLKLCFFIIAGGSKGNVTRAHGFCPWIDAGVSVLFVIDVMPVVFANKSNHTYSYSECCDLIRFYAIRIQTVIT